MRKRKPTTNRPKILLQKQIAELFNNSAAGVAISGDSGTGKSNLMQLLMSELARQGVGITLIDPHGDLAQDFEQSCSALPRSVRDRCQVIRPSDLTGIVSLNPLHVEDCGGDWLRWRARVAAKVSQVAKILLYAWGERDFNSKPVLFKWLTRVLTTMATANLTLPDARHFFQIGGEVFQALANATPDMLGRMEMYELIDMRPREREDLIASTKNRLLGFLENPVVEMWLGRPHKWLDVSALIRQRNITIISLERGGVLREEDVEIFANLWLSELLNAAYNLPRHERTPHVIFLDELPVFASSFETITRALAQVRKFKIRFAAAFQGTQLFPDRTEDRLLNALVSQCRTTIVFRHKNPVDAKFFGELVTLPTLDPLIEKHRLVQTQQYQDGHDRIVLTDESENWSDAQQSGGSQSDSRSDSSSDSASESRSSSTSESRTRQEQTLAEAVSRARGDQQGSSTSRSTSHGTSRTDGTSWSSTSSTGGSRTHRTTLVPRMRWREIVSSIQFLTPEEQLAFGARDITRQPTGEALIYTAGELPFRVQFPLSRGPFHRTPKFADKQVRLLRSEILSRPMFAPPAEISAERLEFEQRLIAHLEQLAHDNQPLTPRIVAASSLPTNPLLNI